MLHKHMVRAFLRSALQFLQTTYHRFWEHDLFLMAAAIAYYGFVAAIPLLLLGASIVGDVAGSSPERYEQIERGLALVFAPDVAHTLSTELIGIVRRRGLVEGVGLVFLIIIGMRIFDVTERVLNRIWHVRDRRPWWKRKAISLGVLLLAGVYYLLWLSLASVLEVTGYRLQLVGINLEQHPSLSRVLSSGVLLAALLAMFLVIYRLLPLRHVRLQDAAVGAVFAAVLWEVARSVFFWSVARFPTYSRLYGTLATVFVALVWLYFSALILLVGAEVSRICQEFGEQQALRNQPDRSNSSPYRAETQSSNAVSHSSTKAASSSESKTLAKKPRITSS